MAYKYILTNIFEQQVVNHLFGYSKNTKCSIWWNVHFVVHFLYNAYWLIFYFIILIMKFL